MKHRFFSSLAIASLAIAGAFCGAAAAQEQSGTLNPPKVLVTTREDVKPGKGGTVHEAAEAAFVRAFKKGKGTNYLAATTSTGPSAAYFFTGYESFAAWEKDNQTVDKNAGPDLDVASQKDGELLTSTHTMAATRRDDLSYNTNRPIKGLRYFVMVTFRVRPGHTDHFIEARKRAVAAHQKANLQDHFVVYQVTTGAPGGTFVLFVPMSSLSEMDDFPTVHGKAYQDALGEDGQKAMENFDREGLLSSEAILISMNPKMSYPSKEWVDADPDFWAPKPAAMKAKPAAAKKEAAK